MAHLLQDPWEFTEFCKLLISENVKSYLEIGSFSGGSIEMVVNALLPGSRIVSVDKPWNASKEARLVEVIRRSRKRGYDARLISGDSTDPKMIAAAQELGPYDAVFIDGDHRFAGVESDWRNYGVLGRIVGFHDIARDLPKNQHGGPHQVASFWSGIKDNYKNIEFISAGTRARTDDKAAYGIGVVWRC